MKKYIIIKADTNDADYITEKTSINDEDLSLIMPVIIAINECGKRHNWPSSEYEDTNPYKLYKDTLTEEQIDIFSEYVPHGEYGVHTIESIEVLTIANEEKLL